MLFHPPSIMFAPNFLHKTKQTLLRRKRGLGLAIFVINSGHKKILYKSRPFFFLFHCFVYSLCDLQRKISFLLVYLIEFNSCVWSFIPILFPWPFIKASIIKHVSCPSISLFSCLSYHTLKASIHSVTISLFYQLHNRLRI